MKSSSLPIVNLPETRNVTLKYYCEHASDFYANTVNADMTKHYERFLQNLYKELDLDDKQNSNPKLSSPDHSLRLLDFGCGSGRDSLYFLKQGFRVTAMDGSQELAMAASKLTGLAVVCADFREFPLESSSYEGIWACASLLHLPITDLQEVLTKLFNGLVICGCLYVSFKYGSSTSMRNGRLFTDLNQEDLHKLISCFPNVSIVDEWVTKDVRPDHKNDNWLNAIIVKKSIAVATKRNDTHEK